jgi:hypothetical protein
MLILIAGTVVIFCVICRLAMLQAHTPRVGIVALAYLMMAGWASSRGLEVLAGDEHTWTDVAGIAACALYLLADMPRWRRGVPSDLRREGA